MELNKERNIGIAWILSKWVNVLLLGSLIIYKVRCMNVDFEDDKNGKDDVDAGCVKNNRFYDVLRLILTREYQIGRVREMID